MSKRNIKYSVTLNFNLDDLSNITSDEEIVIQIMHNVDGKDYYIGDFSIFGDNKIRKNPLQYVKAGISCATDDEFNTSGLSIFSELNYEQFNSGNPIYIPNSFLKALSYYVKKDGKNIIIDDSSLYNCEEDATINLSDDEILQRRRDSWY